MSNFYVNKTSFDFVEENVHHQINKSNMLTDVYNFYYLANIGTGIYIVELSTLRNIGSGSYF
jgi:hypothetical protein